jgi:nitrite reductase/ring-hydroxylating ferredoxin subunit
MKQELLDRLAVLQDSLTAPVTRARSISPDCYTSDEIFAAEIDALVRPGWISVARSSEVAKPGDWKVIESSGEKILLSRDRDGSIKALSPVCRHKWVQLAQGSGHSTAFVCPYHRWTYDLDGRLRGAPFVDLKCLAPEQRQLGQFAVEEWQGWIFVNFDGRADSLAERLYEIDEIVRPWRMAELVPLFPPLHFGGGYNWKTLCDNVGESYHVIGTHPESILPYADLEGSRWHTDGKTWCRSDVPSGVRRLVGLAGPTLACSVEEFIGTWTYNIYPFHIFGLVEDFVVWQRLDLRAAGEISMELNVLVAPEVLEAPGIEEFRSQIEESVRDIENEDQEAFRLSYQGQKLRGALRGSFSRFEEGTLHFQRWWVKAMMSHYAES